MSVSLALAVALGLVVAHRRIRRLRPSRAGASATSTQAVATGLLGGPATDGLRHPTTGLPDYGGL